MHLDTERTGLNNLYQSTMTDTKSSFGLKNPNFRGEQVITEEKLYEALSSIQTRNSRQPGLQTLKTPSMMTMSINQNFLLEEISVQSKAKEKSLGKQV